MKKIFSLAVILLFAVSFTAFADIFLIEKNNGDVLEFNIDDIKEMRFKAGDVETGNLAPDNVQIVDLGLSVCWASCNVGANSVEETGDFVQWGTLEPISWYSWSYYPWGNAQTISKYNVNDGQVYLQTQDDLASQEWGTDWRMPTQDEANELLNPENCTIQVDVVENGVYGVKITSKKEGYEGKYIFLPYNGVKQDNLNLYGGNVYLWTNTVARGWYQFAMSLCIFGAGDVDGNYQGSGSVVGNYRYLGMNIRPVYTKEPPQNPGENEDPEEDNKDVVDMGVSVLWGNYNAGASSPEDPGTFVAWGETESKDNYSSSTYKFGDSYMKYTKYSNSNKVTVLEPEDDAATAILGEEWRTPTSDEWNELIAACDYETAQVNGVNGIKLISKVEGFEGNSIFIPMTGYKQDGGEINPTAEIYLWTATVSGTSLMTQRNAYAFKYVLFPEGVSVVSHDRVYGCPVRGVKNK